jgi:molybdate transport system ATP-binding protein
MTVIDIRDLTSKRLSISQWTIETWQYWCLIGTTGSGKSQLANIFQQPEKMTFKYRRFELPPSCLCVGLEAQQVQFEAELYNDDTDFTGQIDHGHTGLELLQQTGADSAAIWRVVGQFNIEYLMEKGFRVLSSGETRKLLIVRALLAKPDLLILDEPFEGLDRVSSQSLADFLVDLKEQQALIMFVSQLQDVQKWHTHIGVLHKGRLLAQGEKNRIMNNDSIQTLFHFDSGKLLELPPTLNAPVTFDPILHMRNCKVRYDEVIQFQNLNWVLRPGEHTVISGPNGSGKSTLMQLITGDHPQCYNNDLTVFGYQRGSGESIWDIKKHIGIVSGSLHQDYRVPGNALTVVASGLYDSIGLYRTVSKKEKRISRQWLAFLGMEKKANIAFRQLSWGEQRLVLIARGLIKYPSLLILDEPTLGLDDQNRLMILACLERIAGMGVSTMLFISHRQDEHPDIFKKHLVFERDKDALFTITLS